MTTKTPTARTGKARTGHSRAPALLLAPSGAVLVLATIVPIALLIGVSFTDYGQRSLFTGAFSFAGVEQYAAITSDPNFWASFVRTIVFTAAMVGGSVVTGMAVSTLLTRVGAPLRYSVTVVLIFAWAMPNVAASLIWKWLFQPGYGVVNWGLTRLGIFGDMTNTDWSNDAALSFLSIWLLVVWQAVPFIALTLYAAEMQVPIELTEAARLDGSAEFAVYRHVTLPTIAPTLLLITILSIIWDFNVFNQIWLVSGGGPDGATSTLGVFTYTTAFVGFDIARGAAIAVVTTAMLVGLTAVYIRNLIKTGEDL